MNEPVGEYAPTDTEEQGQDLVVGMEKDKNQHGTGEDDEEAGLVDAVEVPASVFLDDAEVFEKKSRSGVRDSTGGRFQAILAEQGKERNHTEWKTIDSLARAGSPKKQRHVRHLTEDDNHLLDEGRAAEKRYKKAKKRYKLSEPLLVVITSKPTITLYQEDYDRLLPGEWLNDKLVDFYVAS